jgi:CRISPR-associated protein Csm5
MVAVSENGLTKPERGYENKRIQLTSPMLHIGSAVSKLDPFEYVQTDKRVYLPNTELLARALNERGRLQDFMRRIDDRREITSLLEDVLGSDWHTACLNGERIFPKQASSVKWTSQRITDLRPMIRNGLGQLYIPGSSIKGAIRTAIAYHLLKHRNRYNLPKQQHISEIETKLRQSMGNLRQRAKFADDDLFMNQLFTDFELTYQDKQINSRQGPNTDFMRAVHLTDTEPILEQKVVSTTGRSGVVNLSTVAEVVISSRFPDYKAKYRAPLYVEMVRVVKTQFSINLDTEMLSWFRHRQGMQVPFKTIDDILTICQEFTQHQWDYEHDYWEDIQDDHNTQGRNLDFSNIREFYEPTKCPYALRLGWASGMPGTTVNLLFANELRAEIRDTCGLKAPGFEAPKSRRSVVGPSGEIQFVPGWSRLRIL